MSRRQDKEFNEVRVESEQEPIHPVGIIVLLHVEEGPAPNLSLSLAPALGKASGEGAKTRRERGDGGEADIAARSLTEPLSVRVVVSLLKCEVSLIWSAAETAVTATHLDSIHPLQGLSLGHCCRD